MDRLVSRWDPDEHAAVIALEMREQQRVDAAGWNAKLKQPHGCPAIGIDHEMGLNRPLVALSRSRAKIRRATGELHPQNSEAKY